MNNRKKVLELFAKQKDYWQDRTEHSIELYRKGFGYITLKDKDGAPVTGAKIKVSQKDHEFRFGANLFMLDELETEEKNEIYKKCFADVFNMATLPFYWDATEPEKGKTRYEKNSTPIYRRPAIDLCVEFCEKHGIEPREHALAYAGFFPKWLKDASNMELKFALEKRYAEISERYKDKIPTIEVTNEMFWENGVHSFYKDSDFVSHCFKLAEKYFPSNTLCINESTSNVWDGAITSRDRYYSYIASNIAKGARIDAIGMQYHMFFNSESEYDDTRRYYDPERLYGTLDLYSQFSKPIHITEVTVPAYSWNEEDEAIQAEIIEYLYHIWFSHKNVDQIVYWNTVDGYAHLWDPDPQKIKASQGNMSIGENYYYGGLLRFDMSPKPAYHKIKELIEKKWHTDAQIETSQDGEAHFKGFYGHYDVEIEINGKCVNKTINLNSKANNKFEIIV